MGGVAQESAGYLASLSSTRPAHQALQPADVLQLDLRVLQLLGQSRLDSLGLQTSGFAFLQLIGDGERVGE